VGDAAVAAGVEVGLWPFVGVGGFRVGGKVAVGGVGVGVAEPVIGAGGGGWVGLVVAVTVDVLPTGDAGGGRTSR
jgi:hypothetical protein